MENVPSSASATIETIALRVSRALDQAIGWPFYDLGSGSRYFDGSGTPILNFDVPLRAPSSVTVNTGSLTRNIDFYLYPANASPYWYMVRVGAGEGESGLLGAMPRSSRAWYRDPADAMITWGTSPLGVVVTGSWGYDVTPDPIVEATIEMTVRLWKARDQGYSDVIGVRGITTQVIMRAFPPFIQDVIDTFRSERHFFA